MREEWNTLLFAGGSPLVPRGLPHTLPCHCPNCAGHLQRVWGTLQDLPYGKLAVALSHYQAYTTDKVEVILCFIVYVLLMYSMQKLDFADICMGPIVILLFTSLHHSSCHAVLECTVRSFQPPQTNGSRRHHSIYAISSNRWLMTLRIGIENIVNVAGRQNNQFI